MKFFNFQINTIIFLSIIVVGIVAWVGFEFYHRQNSLDIDPALYSESESSLPSSFDTETLKSIYNSKDNFYEKE